MTIRSAIITIIGCTLLLAGIGAGSGYGLGTFAPDYYRGVFIRGRDPGFDPVSVGVGQGLTQGTAGGVVVGLALVALFCWREIRLRGGHASTLLPHGHPAKSGSAGRSFLLVAGAVLMSGVCFSCGLLAGVLGGSRSAYHHRYREELDAIAPILAGDPAFERVEIHESSAGGVYLAGEVPTAKDRDRLREKVVRAIGERRAESIMIAVDVRR